MLFEDVCWSSVWQDYVIERTSAQKGITDEERDAMLALAKSCNASLTHSNLTEEVRNPLVNAFRGDIIR